MNYEEKLLNRQYNRKRAGQSNDRDGSFSNKYGLPDHQKQRIASNQGIQPPVTSKPTFTPAQGKNPTVQIKKQDTPDYSISARQQSPENPIRKPASLQHTVQRFYPGQKQQDFSETLFLKDRNSSVRLTPLKNPSASSSGNSRTISEIAPTSYMAEMSMEEKIAEGLVGQPINVTVPKTEAERAAILMYPSDPDMQSWAKNYLQEQGFDQPVEKANLNTIKTQVDNAYDNHTTGKRQEEKHAEVAQEHKRRTDEAAEQKRKAEEEAAQKKEAEAQRRAALDQKYDEKAPSVRMAERLLQSPEELMKNLPELEREFPGIEKHFPELIDRHPELISKIAEELQAQNYDTYIRSNYIDIDDETQWDPKSVRDMSQHLLGIFWKIAYEEFEQEQQQAIQNGTLPELNGQIYGPKIMFDTDYVKNHGVMGLAELVTKREHNDYATDKIANSATTAGEAYVNQLTEGARQAEGIIDHWREKLFGRDDLFNAKQVEEAEKERVTRAEEEHPLATAAGKATVELIKSGIGKAIPLEDILSLGGKAGQAVIDLLDEMTPSARSLAEKMILSTPEAFLEGAYEGKSMEEIMGDISYDVITDSITEPIIDTLPTDKIDWVVEAGLTTLGQQYKDDILKMPKQLITEVEKTVQKYFPGIPSQYLLRFSGALRDQVEKMIENPAYQRMDEQGKQMYLNNAVNNVLQQFWKYYHEEKR